MIWCFALSESEEPFTRVSHTFNINRWIPSPLHNSPLRPTHTLFLIALYVFIFNTNETTTTTREKKRYINRLFMAVVFQFFNAPHTHTHNAKIKITNSIHNLPLNELFGFASLRMDVLKASCRCVWQANNSQFRICLCYAQKFMRTKKLRCYRCSIDILAIKHNHD